MIGYLSSGVHPLPANAELRRGACWSGNAVAIMILKISLVALVVSHGMLVDRSKCGQPGDLPPSPHCNLH
jgi:hypothetical protein